MNPDLIQNVIRVKRMGWKYSAAKLRKGWWKGNKHLPSVWHVIQFEQAEYRRRAAELHEALTAAE